MDKAKGDTFPIRNVKALWWWPLEEGQVRKVRHVFISVKVGPKRFADYFVTLGTDVGLTFLGLTFKVESHLGV